MPRVKFGPPSVRWLIIFIVVLPIALVSAALVTISVLTSRAISEQLGNALVAGATARVSGEIRTYLSDAVRVSDLYTRRILSGELPDRAPFPQWESQMLDELATSANVAAITFGNDNGESTYLMRGREGRIELGRFDPNIAPDNCVESVVDGSGKIQSTIRKYLYEPRQRPWYTQAVDSTAPGWTSVYFWFGNTGAASQTGTGYTRLVRGSNGKPQGVLVVDVTLAALSEFLRRLPLAEQGYAFIVDEKNLLVAASDALVNSPSGDRLAMSASESPAARAVGSLSERTSAQQDIRIDGAPARAEVTPLQPFPGMKWKLITVLPESSFLAEADAVRRRSILMALGAVAGATLLGLVFSRRLSRPMQKLTAHVARVGGGDFDARLDLNEAREFQHLSGEINTMAAGLKQRMELEQALALADQVQQSLLPNRMPKVAGMEIAGQSAYCDLAGGDYYDFVEVSTLPRGHAMIAIGDVTGHGIGAALLMATARAAVRAAAPLNESLGKLMEQVNRVLTEDSRHGLFMTLLIMVVDPIGRTVRWSSGGHDPVIGYDPATDKFFSLDDGDVLLGLLPDTEYSEFLQTNIPPGSILFAGTDGIWEAPNEEQEMFGKDRLREFIRANASRSVSEIAAEMDIALQNFRGNAVQNDDVTFVVMKLVPVAERK
jgi:sigma-B regulation protein RsbU (phosphoserine phosphatase)